MKLETNTKFYEKHSFTQTFFSVSGIMCIVLAVVVLVMDLRFPQEIAYFFNVDIIQDSEELQVERAYQNFLTQSFPLLR